MSCYLDGALDQADAVELWQHVAGCPRCRDEWAAMEAVSALFARAPQVSPAEGFSTRVMLRLARREARSRLVGGGTVLLVGAAVLTTFTLLPLAAAWTEVEPLLLHPSLLSGGMKAIWQLAAVLRALVEVAWLVIAALAASLDPAQTVVYALVVLALTVLWTRVVGYRVQTVGNMHD
jgi:anti-sigma factor RsiW